jgi:hypothetical protein
MNASSCLKASIHNLPRPRRRQQKKKKKKNAHKFGRVRREGSKKFPVEAGVELEVEGLEEVEDAVGAGAGGGARGDVADANFDLYVV